MKCKICGLEVKSIAAHLKTSHPDVNYVKYYNEHIKSNATEGFCLTCGRETFFLGLTKGFRKYCCNSCAQSNPSVQNKIKKTYKERTGYEHNSMNPESKQRMIETNKKNNGGILFFQRPDVIEEMKEKKLSKFGSYNNIEKIKKTNLEHYGVENQYQRRDIINKNILSKIEKYGSSNNIEKIKKTNTERYGVQSLLSLKRIHDDLKIKIYNNKLKKYSSILNDNNSLLISLNDNTATCRCKNCNKKYEIQLQLIRKRSAALRQICINCNPLIPIIDSSKSEIEIFEYLKSFCLNIEQSNRIILNGKELDIYVPSKKIAIEFNGLYWHSDEYKDYDYHLNKTEECEKQGIHLIHIYEDDWLYKQDIVKSRLKSILGFSERKIFARKCVIKELDNDEAKSFLEEHHLQGGGINSKYRYGLYHENELVACMTFGASRFEKNKIELHRFANKLGSNVIGGASRLFKHFLNTIKPTEVVSYADRSWTMNNGKSVYEQLGFKLLNKTRPNYYYINGDYRVNRFKYRKSELVKEGFDASKSESEIMEARGYNKIYDSGNLKFIYKV